MGAGGLGDAVQGLLVVAALRRERPDVEIVYRVGDKGLPFAALFREPDEITVHDCDLNGNRRIGGPELQLNHDYGLEIRSRSEVSRIDRYLRNARVEGGPAMPTLREPERVRDAGKEYAGYVVLCPFSAYSDREWSVPHWMALEDLLKAKGYRCVVLHSEEFRTERLKSEKVIGAPAEKVAGIMMNSACVIGCDSGLAHLAGTLGKPVVVLCGQTSGEKVFGCYKSAKWIDGPLPCSGCYWSGAAYSERSCRPHCPSLQAITPERVLAEVDAVVLGGLTHDKTLVSVDRLARIRDAVLATAHLDGAIAELGTYKGGVAKLISHYAPGVRLDIYDTFSGIPTDDIYPGWHVQGEFSCGLDEVKAYVNNPAAVYHVGKFPDTALKDAKYKLAVVDMDTYQSTKDALEHLRTHMVPDGQVILDDYCWEDCPGVARALKESGLPYKQSAMYQAAIAF
jgi:ADP-heptose:LPS heptosyltransferase